MESSKVYHISPIHLRSLEVERYARNRNNAYDGLKELAHMTRKQKELTYDTLKESIEHKGFNKECPIIIMLRRVNNKDQILQGHHRLNIAIELELPTVPVRFVT